MAGTSKRRGIHWRRVSPYSADLTMQPLGFLAILVVAFGLLIALEAGDVLVLQGDAEALARLERAPAFLMLGPFHGQPRLWWKAALAAVLFGCISPHQAYQELK